MSSIVVSLFTGAIAFGVARFLDASVESSLAYGFASASVAFLFRGLETAEKLLKIDDLWAGVVKRRKEAREQSRIVKAPTPTEIEQYGFSVMERRIWARSKYEIESEMIMAQEFIERASENSVDDREKRRNASASHLHRLG